MENEEHDSTNMLLRVIIALLLRRKDDQLLPLKQQVQILDDLGLRPTDIAKILGRSSTYVNKELVGIRKKRRGA